MASALASPDALDQAAAVFYRRVMTALQRAGVPFLVGGAYSMSFQTGVVRHTKDLDIFLMPSDVGRALDALAAEGFRTEITYPHWLGKVFSEDSFVDVIFSSGNGVAAVDEDWFRHADAGEVLGTRVLFCPPEETIWSKGYVMERERYDGSDVAHLIRACGHRLEWRRLIDRYGPHWRVLLSHLVLFGFIYPGERTQVPKAVLAELLARLQSEPDDEPDNRLCQGTLLSAVQYLVDVRQWGYQDARPPEAIGRLPLPDPVPAR
jgi:hypothetical protein